MTTGNSNRRRIASSLHGRFEIAGKIAAKIASANEACWIRILNILDLSLLRNCFDYRRQDGVILSRIDRCFVNLYVISISD